VFRPAALLVATLLGLAPSAGLLCKALCVPEFARVAACHTPHDMTSVGAGHANDCDAAGNRLTSMPADRARADASPDAAAVLAHAVAGFVVPARSGSSGPLVPASPPAGRRVPSSVLRI
jgi:hypothetical protein